jgi:hypothetical protein
MGPSIPRSFHRREQASTREPARHLPSPDRSLFSFRLTGHKAGNPGGTSALALAVAFCSLDAPPGKAREGPVHPLPAVEDGTIAATKDDGPGTSAGGGGWEAGSPAIMSEGPAVATKHGTPIPRRARGSNSTFAGRINENCLIGNYSHDDARILNGQGLSDFSGPGIACTNFGTFVNESGNRLQDIPLNAGNIWVKYDAGGVFNSLSQVAGLYARQRHVMYRFQLDILPWVMNATVQLNINNLFNTTYYRNSSTNLSIFPGQPRTFLDSMRAEF